MYSDKGPFICESVDNNRGLNILTTKGNYVTKISVEHRSAYIQGEEVLVTLKNGRTAIYSVRGSYKRLI